MLQACVERMRVRCTDALNQPRRLERSATQSIPIGSPRLLTPINKGQICCWFVERLRSKQVGSIFEEQRLARDVLNRDSPLRFPALPSGSIIMSQRDHDKSGRERCVQRKSKNDGPRDCFTPPGSPVWMAGVEPPPGSQCAQPRDLAPDC